MGGRPLTPERWLLVLIALQGGTTTAAILLAYRWRETAQHATTALADATELAAKLMSLTVGLQQICRTAGVEVTIDDRGEAGVQLTARSLREDPEEEGRETRH